MTLIGILGGLGQMGRVVTRQLLDSGHDVVVFDAAYDGKGPDLSDRAMVAKCIAPMDVVVNCLPGAIGYTAAVVTCELGKPLVDLSFMPEDVMGTLPARQAPVIVDAGLCPGLSNLVVGHLSRKLDLSHELVNIYVGGVAPTPKHGWHGYALTWSADDLREEYIRPARMLIGGEVHADDPFDTVVLDLEFDDVGKMDAFRSDGLRTLLHQEYAPNIAEYTLRWPGHLDALRPHIEAGTPLGELLPRSNMDTVVMEVCVSAAPKARLIDHSDGFLTAMQRTTAFTCAATVEAMLMPSDAPFEPGVYGLEELGRRGMLPVISAYLASRGVHLQLT